MNGEKEAVIEKNQETVKARSEKKMMAVKIS